MKTVTERSLLDEICRKASENTLRGIFDLPSDIYHHNLCPGLSRSQVMQLLKSPAHFQAYLKNEEIKKSKTMDFGTAAHSVLLEPDTFAERVTSYPDTEVFKLHPNTTKYKEAKAEFEAAHPSKIILKPKEMENLGFMIEALYSHPTASSYLKGIREKTFFWENEESGVLCKVKPDCLNIERHLVVDFKTTHDASPGIFKQGAMKYGYHLQHSFYLEGINEAVRQAGTEQMRPFVDEIEDFCFVVIENEAPYGIAIYYLDNDSVQLGKDLTQHALKLFKKCTKENQWPSYPREPKEIGVPQYMFYDLPFLGDQS